MNKLLFVSGTYPTFTGGDSFLSDFCLDVYVYVRDNPTLSKRSLPICHVAHRLTPDRRNTDGGGGGLWNGRLSCWKKMDQFLNATWQRRHWASLIISACVVQLRIKSGLPRVQEKRLGNFGHLTDVRGFVINLGPQPLKPCLHVTFASNIRNGSYGNNWWYSHLTYVFSRTGWQRSKENANADVKGKPAFMFFSLSYPGMCYLGFLKLSCGISWNCLLFLHHFNLGTWII